jgi:hypothetical protein
MIKLKSILSEGYAWEREPGKPLPTLEQTTAAHAAKLAEQSAEQLGSDPMTSQQDDVFDIIMTYTKDPDEAEAAYEAWLNGDSMPAAIEANVTRDPRWAAIRQPQREAAKPDFLDLDGDGDKQEPMKKAAAERKEDMHEAFARRLMNNLKGSEHILTETFRRK